MRPVPGVSSKGLTGQRGGYIQVIDEMQETGYAGTELGDWGFMPTDPTRLTQELGSRHLSLLAAVGRSENMIVLGNDLYGDPVRTKYAGRITPAMQMNEDQWTMFANGANHVARRVMDEAGLRTAFHHHPFSYVPVM